MSCVMVCQQEWKGLRIKLKVIWEYGNKIICDISDIKSENSEG
jgi:hypothetical protein